MGSFGKFLGGLLVGMAVGAGVTMFATPRTGDETRSELANKWDSAVNSGKAAAKQREAELWAEFNTRAGEQNSIVAPA